MRPFKAWIALSSHGYPAWFIGFHRTQKALRGHYRNHYTHDLEQGGYSPMRVTISRTSTTTKEKR